MEQSKPDLLQVLAENKPFSAAQPQQPGPEEKKEMVVTGHVLDPDGRPVAGAQVGVMCHRKFVASMELGSDLRERLGLTRTDSEGRFRLRVRRTTSITDYTVSVIAAAGGYGLGWQSLHPDVEQPTVVVRLHREQLLRGRLIDLQGQGAAGVKVYLAYIAVKNPKELGVDTVGIGELAESWPPWPAPVTTDKGGRLVFHGIGRDLLVGLHIIDDRFARQTLHRVDTRDGQHAQEVTLLVAPPQVVEGQVTCEDTGREVANARLIVQRVDRELNRPSFVHGSVTGRTDAQGRFRMSSYPGNTVAVQVLPVKGTAYLGVRKYLPWPKGTVNQKLDLALPRGVLVGGRVTESGSGKPVAGAKVDFVPRIANNPYYRNDILFSHLASGVVTGSDGTFHITVLPGPSHLVVQSSTPDFIQREVYYDHSTGEFLDTPATQEPGIRRQPRGHWFLSGFAPLDLKPEVEPPAVNITLRRGVTVKGRLVGPAGKPVAKAKMLCRLAVAYTVGYGGLYPVDLPDDRFELPGCDPDKTYPVYFLDARNQQGAVAEISAKQGSEPVEVRLAPCGSAVVRLVNQQGKPLSNYRPNPYGMEMVVQPGFLAGPKDQKQKPADPDTVRLRDVDPLHYLDGVVADAQGRITLPALIPAAMYRINSGGAEKEFTVEAGKTVELPDMMIPYPGD